jgi:hypothetical protein
MNARVPPAFAVGGRSTHSASPAHLWDRRKATCSPGHILDMPAM